MSISITITVPPSAPTRSDPDNFRERADDYIDWHVNTHVPELNTVIDDFNATIQNLFVGTSSTSNTIGTGSKTWTVVEDNLAYGIGMALRVARTSDPTSYWMEGIVTTYNKSTKALTIQVQTSHGSGTFTDWTFSHKPQEDYSRVRAWSGMGPVAASLPMIVSHNGAYWVLNTNLADVTAKEPGVDVEWDSLVNPTYEEFTESGTWAKPAGVKWVYVDMVGGGCSGDAIVSDTTGHALNGGAGGMSIRTLYRASDLPATVDVVVGAGGAAANVSADTTTQDDGHIGGASSFGSLETSATTNTLFPPLHDANNTANIAVGNYNGGRTATSTGRPGGDCVIGGAGGGAASSTGESSDGGISQIHGDGGAGAWATDADVTATDGSVPGGGGGAAAVGNATTTRTATSGAGGDGVVRVWAW